MAQLAGKPRKTTEAGTPGKPKGSPAADEKGRGKATSGLLPEPTSFLECNPTVAPGFPIVGIGASAGGLEALELFLKNVPHHSGMAFVLVQHMDPTHKGAMVELLQRTTTMPVIEVEDRHRVEPDHVYLIPPNKDMSMLNGVLHLLPPAASKGLRLPIDFFFRSLAEDQQDRSVGVVLSGMGSDGTLGLRAIKEKAGASFVQALSSAKFDGMPRSAIDAGLADVVAPAEELPSRIVSFIRHVPRDDVLEEKAQSALEKIFTLLRTQTGNDFSQYKRSTLYRRIERRMGLHQIDTIGKYASHLRENPIETEQLSKELLIGVTSFFRDPTSWEHLRRDVLPRYLKEHSGATPLRAWVPGCSTGEEAYSLAIVFKESLEQIKPIKSLPLQIFATDLDREAIERARIGLYPTNIVADVSQERLRRFFLQDDRGYRVGKDIREMVVFAPQNILMDPPFTKLDILSCRNLLIYLSAEVQRRLIPLFHYSLCPGGILILGSAESVGGFASLFSPLDGKTRIYRREKRSESMQQVDLPVLQGVYASGQNIPPTVVQPSAGPASSLQSQAERVLLQRFSPAAVLTNDKGDILYFTGRTGKYLEPAAGRANFNVLAMAREGLRYELGNAFSVAAREERPVTVRRLRVKTNGGSQTVDICVERLLHPETLRGTMMVVFTDIAEETLPKPTRPSGAKEKREIADLQDRLHHALEETQSTREEMQTSQEELKSMNEELQSTNEELQSTNEELSTSKEEMQSLNEELQTVNHELQAKVDELSRSNNDMKNLLNSTDIATLFLDGELHIRRFTTETTKLIKLIPGDVGRPVTDITTEINYPDLDTDAREVLRTLAFKEKTVAARGGQWYLVRIMPYRTLENVIDGVVITFTDVTVSKKLEAALRSQADQLSQMAEAFPNMVWAARPDGAWDFVSRQWGEYTGVPEAEQLGFGWLEQIHPEDRTQVRERWKSSVASETAFDVETRILSKNGGHRLFKARAVPIRDESGDIVRWYGSSMDIEELKGSGQRHEKA